jgi:iron complex outermembrane receptor protein
MHPKFMVILSLFLSFYLIPVLTSAQNCTSTLVGCIKDANTGISMRYTNILIKEFQKGATSDSSGCFQINDLCEGEITLIVYQLGYLTDTFSVFIPQDTLVDFYLKDLTYNMNEVLVSKDKAPTSAQPSASLSEEEILQNADKNLSNLLENIVGVSTLKNGNGISKPVVHGLSGNRLIVLNNGVVQSGQQWGNDHSPEIDPLVANQISVIKGAAALEYQGSSLGGFILVEPNKINKSRKLNGRTNYYFESNGFGHGLNLQLEMNHPLLAWKITGTLKKSGDRHSPSYFLRNTGNQEANIAIQLEKSFSDKWFTKLYFSSFNTEIGILRGSHIGNLTDLRSALVQEVPFFTKPYFSYAIEAPFQRVGHHLLKLNSRYYINSNQYIDFTYAGQLNNRKEFDVRRGNASEKPALALRQWTNAIEGKYFNAFDNGLTIKTGIQGRFIDNTNSPETGVLPLIPDYFAYEVGAFVHLTKRYKKIFLDFGGRYDFMHQAVAAISTYLPREIVRYNNNFHNFSALIGLNYQALKTLKIALNVGYATRNPSINELYSNGLHQGVSGIEEGDVGLKIEQALKTTLGIDWNFKKTFFIEALFYHQWINNYIYLNPQEEIRLTIRGAFPVYKYQQSLAQIYGLDLSATYNITKKLSIKAQYAYLRGDDLGNQIPLVYMPANNLFAKVSYVFPKVGSFSNLALELHNKYVFRQNNLLPSQDFTPVPNAYNLLGLSCSIERNIKNVHLKIYARIDNLLNTKYRDYLNRQRYFADALGINGTIGLSLTF